MHHRSRTEGSSDDEELHRHQAAFKLLGFAGGAVVTDRLGRHEDGPSQTSRAGWYASMRSPVWPSSLRRSGLQDERFTTRTITLAAIVSLVIAIITAIATSKHFSFEAAFIIALGALFCASIASSALVRFRQDPTPSPAEERAAISRISTIVSSLLERYGIEEPEIDVPLKLIDASGSPSNNDLARRLATAQVTTISDFFTSQLVDRPRLTVILGESGAGKTALLLRLANRMLADRSENSRGLIPLFLKCRDWSDDYVSFQKWLTATAVQSYQIPIRVSDYWIRSGKLFVALDGLHELPSDSHESFSTAINSWVQSAEGTRLAISSTMQPSMADLVRSLGVDQLCFIQPLPDSDIRQLLRRTLSRLSFQDNVSALQVTDSIRAMDGWMRSLVSNNPNMQGPALVGLLAEAIEESEQLPDEAQHLEGSTDPATVAFLVGNSFFTKGDFAAARNAYSAITLLSHSRWHVPAYTLLATCLYFLGDVDGASNAMMESVALRLKESIHATPDAVEPLSDEELQCLAAVPHDVSFDVAQISSTANLSMSETRQALQALRERGLVETVADTGDRARFRQSISASAVR